MPPGEGSILIDSVPQRYFGGRTLGLRARRFLGELTLSFYERPASRHTVDLDQSVLASWTLATFDEQLVKLVRAAAIHTHAFDGAYADELKTHVVTAVPLVGKRHQSRGGFLNSPPLERWPVPNNVTVWFVIILR